MILNPNPKYYPEFRSLILIRNTNPEYLHWIPTLNTHPSKYYLEFLEIQTQNSDLESRPFESFLSQSFTTTSSSNSCLVYI
jgi:hypothetical protein